MWTAHFSDLPMLYCTPGLGTIFSDSILEASGSELGADLIIFRKLKQHRVR